MRNGSDSIRVIQQFLAGALRIVHARQPATHFRGDVQELDLRGPIRDHLQGLGGSRAALRDTLKYLIAAHRPIALASASD